MGMNLATPTSAQRPLPWLSRSGRFTAPALDLPKTALAQGDHPFGGFYNTVQRYLWDLKNLMRVQESLLPEPPPAVKPEELVVVEEIVKYREALAKRLVQLVNRLMELKLSKSRDTHTSTYATSKRRSKKT